MRKKCNVAATRGLTRLAVVSAVCGAMIASMLVWTGQPAVAAATGSPLTFGVMGTDSGPYTLAEEGLAFKAYVANWNAHGGYKGHPIKIRELDGQFDPTTTANNARILVDSDGVIGIAGDYNLIDCNVDNSFYAASHIAVLGPGSAGCFIPNIDFPLTKIGGSAGASVFVKFLRKLGAKHLGLVIPSVSVTVPIISAVSAEAKLDHVPLSTYSTPIVATASELDVIISQMKTAGVDAVMLVVQSSQNQLFIQQAALQNFGPGNHIAYVLGPSMYAPSNLSFTQGTYIYSYGYPWSAVQGQQALAVLKHYGVKASQLDGYSQQGYAAAAEFQQVLDLVKGPVTRSSFLRAAEHATSIHPPLSPPEYTISLINPTKDKDAGFILKSTPSGFKLDSGFIVTNN